MEDNTNSKKRTARIAGLLYLVVIVFGGFSELYVRSGLIVPGDAAATANNIRASESLFRIGFICDIIMITSYFLMGRVLYGLLKNVNKNMAMLMVFFNLIGVPILGLNMLNHVAALMVLSGADYLNAFNTAQLNALSMLFLNFHKYGYLIATLSFGTYLLPLGYLVFKSGYFPKVLGILLMVASISFLIDFIVQFVFPEYVSFSTIILVPTGIGELSFCLWLLIKGVKDVSVPTLESNLIAQV